MYSYKDIVNIITELRSTGSSNSKKEILEKYKDDNEWKRFLVYVYDVNGKVYGKTKLPIIPLVETIDETDFNAEGILEEIYALLDSMAGYLILFWSLSSFSHLIYGGTTIKSL